MQFAALHMSAYGTSRHFVAVQHFGRFLTEADVNRIYSTRPSTAAADSR